MGSKNTGTQKQTKPQPSIGVQPPSGTEGLIRSSYTGTIMQLSLRMPSEVWVIGHTVGGYSDWWAFMSGGSHAEILAVSVLTGSVIRTLASSAGTVWQIARSK